MTRTSCHIKHFSNLGTKWLERRIDGRGANEACFFADHVGKAGCAGKIDMAIAVGGDRVDRKVAGVSDGGEFEAGESIAHSLWVGLGTQAGEKQAKQRQESHLEII